MTAKKPLVRNGSGAGMSEVQLASSDLSDGVNLTAIGSLANAFGCLRNDGAGNFMYSLPWPAAAPPASSPVNTDYSNSAANNVYARRKSASSRTYAVRSFN